MVFTSNSTCRKHNTVQKLSVKNIFSKNAFKCLNDNCIFFKHLSNAVYSLMQVNRQENNSKKAKVIFRVSTFCLQTSNKPYTRYSRECYRITVTVGV